MSCVSVVVRSLSCRAFIVFIFIRGSWTKDCCRAAVCVLYIRQPLTAAAAANANAHIYIMYVYITQLIYIKIKIKRFYIYIYYNTITNYYSNTRYIMTQLFI